jgi:cell division protein FtsW (lipid II flippase)
MNPTVRIRPFVDTLSSGSTRRFPEFFRERMRLFPITLMPLLMSFGLIVDQGMLENKRHDYLPEAIENHGFSVFVETYGILPVVLIAAAVLILVFFGIRWVIRTNRKRNASTKMNRTK